VRETSPRDSVAEPRFPEPFVAQHNHLALLICAGFVACAPDADPVRTDAGIDSGPFTASWCKPSLAAGTTATVFVGEGQTFYKDIADNTELIWEKGPQGGHHVWIALRQRGLRMSGTIITIDLEDVEDPAKPRLVNHSRLIYDFDKDEGFDPEKGGFCTRPGLRMQLDNAGAVPLVELLGHKVRVKTELKDPDGAIATGTKTIIVKGTLD
jgi:hypothetical protein